MNRRLLSVLLLPVVGVLAAVPAHAQQDTWALTNARIVQVSGPVIPSGTILIRDGLIAQVGANVTVPADARVLDLSGKTVYPGMIDLVSTVSLPQQRTAAPAGGGFAAALLAAQRDTAGPQGQEPHRMVLDEVRPGDRTVAEWRDQGVTTALVAPSSGMFRGQSALVNLRGESASEMAVASPVALHMGFEPLRGRYPSTLMGAMAYQRQSFLDARHLEQQLERYARNPRGMSRPVRSPDLEVLIPYLNNRGLVVIDARSQRAIRRAVGLAREFNLNYVVSGAGEAWQALDLLVAERKPVIVTATYAAPDSLTGRPFLVTRPEPMPSDSQLQRLIDRNAAVLDSAGITIALASGGRMPAREFRGAVRRAVQAGLSHDAAVRATTLTPARILGVDNRLGSIEAGKIANLVVATGDLFTDTTRVEAVFVDGERFVVEPQAAPAAAGARVAAMGGQRGEMAGRMRQAAAERASGGGALAAEAGEAPEATAPEAAPEEPVRFPTPPAAIPRGRLVAITNATIMTATRGTIERGTIVVRDGRIAAVGPDVQVPRDAEVIDGTGRYVIPGIVDSHSHMGIEGGVNEGTENLTPHVRMTDQIRHDDIQFWNALAGGVTTINVLHGSANSIGGQNAVIKLRWGLLPEQLFVENAPGGIKFALGENPKRSNRPNIPGVPQRFPNTRMGVEFSIAEAFQQASAYRSEWTAYEAERGRARRGQEPLEPRRDLFLEALAGVLDGSIRVHSHGYRADEFLMLLHLADSLGFRIASLQHILEGYKIADEIAAHGAGASTFADNWAFKLEAYDAIPYNMALMHERGVRVSINSDSGERVRRMLQEAAKAMKYGGVSEQDALRMVTLNAAMDLGLGDRLGSIDVGKDADLVILNHHPFDPRARVERTLIDGVIYYDYERAPRLRDQVERPAVTRADEGGAL